MVSIPRNRDSNLMHGYYWLLPVAAAVSWWGMYLGLLLWWAVGENARRYQPGDATIEYVSNIGAEHQWLFILGCALTAVFCTLLRTLRTRNPADVAISADTATLLAERWLRHLRRIPGALRVHDRNCDIAACVFGILGAIALVILSSANDRIYPNVHWSFTAIFVVCIAISALLQTVEIWLLKQDHVERKHLKRNAIIKWIIVGFAIACAIAFVGTYAACAGQPKNQPLTPKCNRVKSVAAVLEWTIAACYGVYLLTFGLDLFPARKTRGHKFEERLITEDKNNTLHAHKDRTLPGAPGGILGGSNADIESGLSSARPSESMTGQYGAMATPLAESEGVTRPEMAHAPTGHESFTPAPSAAYAAPAHASYPSTADHGAYPTNAGYGGNTHPEMAQAAGQPHTIVYHNPHITPLSQPLHGGEGAQRTF
ncbi:hypothetical protein BMF94_1012 [Rhodotorula taiwanensis]|uniref:CWH43-like N-terminal domain-containing protein n=1 Tax=Rhodotorula taiwanensis TaxID=741276 RepID=A0A2S5BGM1_9BASI|nr:hypothetical protein BMF94_1012 [Rhodotorula taiwanensis]